MLGKEKCRILKEIRQRIADENEIPYVTRECRHQGDCRGTCPRCESELRYLESQLAARAALGRRVAVAALCAGMTFSAAGCAPVSRLLGRGGGTELSGAVPYEEPGNEPQIEIETGEVAWPDENENTAGSPLNKEPEPEPVELSGEVAWPEAGEPPAEPKAAWSDLTGDVAWVGEQDGNG